MTSGLELNLIWKHDKKQNLNLGIINQNPKSRLDKKKGLNRKGSQRDNGSNNEE